jgi:hypothetical protein
MHGFRALIMMCLFPNLLKSRGVFLMAGGNAILTPPMSDFFLDVLTILDLFSSRELREHRAVGSRLYRERRVKWREKEKGVCLQVMRLCCIHIWKVHPSLI